jgi:hypothetical protein
MNDEEFDIIEIIPKKENDAPEVWDVLTDARDADLEYALVIGQDEDGKWYFAASEGNVARAVFSVDQFKNFIMSI